MFCEKCGNEIKDGAKFCEKCGAAIETKKAPVQNDINATQKPKSVGRRMVILGIIAAIVIILVVVIILVKRIGKDDVASEPVELNTSTETMLDDLTGELPEIAPDSDEEYEALFDKLEYLTLGDEAENDGVTVEDDLAAENTADTD